MRSDSLQRLASGLRLAPHELHRNRISVAAIVATIAITCSSYSYSRDGVSGSARVLDGDTIAIGLESVRLAGIHAPETDQVCLDASGNRWTCGTAARDRLSSHIAGRTVSCVSRGKDRFGRTLGVCSASGEDLNAWMVREGIALAYVKYSREYLSSETGAREQRKGMWAGAFIAPWEWRERDQETVVLGALSVPVTAQAQLLAPASSAAAPSPECIIKGNVNGGERIYHMPGQSAYSKINMSASKKRWFCSEEEARVAGWRRAKR